MKLRARYECLKCGYRFSFAEAPENGTICIKCGNLYVRWINWFLFSKVVERKLEENEN